MRIFKLQLVISILAIGFLGCSPSYAAVTVNDITQLNPITVDKVIAPKSIEEVSQLVAHHAGPISIGGGRYSQGGQIATENCLFLDMRDMNRVINLDTEKRQITVEAGATWRKIQETIDPKGLSLKIMQSFSNFTVGGSLSVNAHGRYVSEGPIIRSVESIKIVLANGSIKEASRTKNPELFFGAIGGYGGIGVIVEATLNLAENTRIERISQRMDMSQYKDYFFHTIRESKTAIFHNADIYPPDYTQVNAVTWNTTDKPVTVQEKLAPQDKLSSSLQFLLAWISDGPWGKACRQYIYDPYEYSGQKVEWRNYEASYDVIGLEPPSREKSTYVLQEYFIPVENFDSFAPKMAAILNQNHVNVLNVSIRHALSDPGSLLAWARKEVFSFVIYYEQGVADADKKEVYGWTSKLIDAALEEGGTYYLPYQIIATPDQFLKAYPRATEYFALKKRVDPTYKFRNKLWDRHYNDVNESNPKK
jgi:FAD/FMN-containing dehydrogenase